jgi:IclR family KDG regulon transcriptional repressor
MKRPKSDYVIQTVTNALRVLEAFRDDEELGVTELSRRLDLHKNNVFRLLATLEERGYVEQHPGTERYRLGVACLELGQACARNRTLARHARPVLEELAHTTRESVHLGVLSDFQVVHLDGEQPDAQLVLTLSRVGRRLDAHCTALGKVLLACGDASVLERFDRDWISRRGLVAHTPCTVTDREKLLEHLRAVAVQGWAVDVEECAAGLCCAAAPVYDGTGRLAGALSVSGPAFRLGPRLEEQAVTWVLEAAARLSRRLGAAAP